MSISYHVRGIIPTDEKYMKMKTIWDNCNALDIEPPKDVYNFFYTFENYDEGMNITLPKDSICIRKCIKKTDSNNIGNELHIVDLRKIPKEIKFIVFEISYQ